MKPQDTLIQGMIENEDTKNDIENASPMKQDENQTSVVLWRPRTKCFKKNLVRYIMTKELSV